MPQRDSYHASVKQALIKDGWTITHDPYILDLPDETLFVDLAAEQIFAAEQGACKIAVEVKSFLGPSLIAALEQATGQYLLYRSLLKRLEPERQLYLAVSEAAAAELAQRRTMQVLRDDYGIALVVVNIAQEEVTTWTPAPIPPA
ncbi:MAG: fatty-acid synthase [Chloroflexaceae bacterium]|jgi:hypothetical protein|nr:fatty-acid synthase [Chloroflexaceae bacterium]